MINKRSAKAYCRDDISLIENYDKAIADKTQVWDCHHRRETIYSVKELIEIGEYYNRPACELIFLTPVDHRRLHRIGKHLSEDTRQKLSESKKGEKCYIFGKHLSEETRKKISEAHKGKQVSEETRQKLSEAIKCKRWYNNGVICVRAKTCPEGFVPGRLK